MTTMLETLNETVAAYTSKTRAVNPENEGCRYFIDGKCCAVGRCMIDPKKYKDFSGNVTRFHALDLLLKPEYRVFQFISGLNYKFCMTLSLTGMKRG